MGGECESEDLASRSVDSHYVINVKANVFFWLQLLHQ